MSSTPLAETEESVFDLTEAVPETERLDSSLQKAKAQLSIKTRRHRPSRSRLRDSLSSTDGDDSLDGKSFSSPPHSTYSPLHAPHRCSSPSTDLQLSSSSSSSPAWRDRAFTLDPFPETPERKGRYKHLLDTSSQETLLVTPSRINSLKPCSRSETSSPAHLRQGDHVHLHEEDHSLLRQRDHSQSEDDGHDVGSDEPGSPTVLLDKKTRRRFLDLGVTLRRTYGRVRKDRANRLSAQSREPERAEGRTSRSSGPPFVPFSWFSDRIRGSSSPKSSSQSLTKSPAKGSSQDEELDSSAGLLENRSRSSKPESSQPYRSLSEHSDEGCDSRGADSCHVRKKAILPFSTGGRDRTDKQNGVHSNKDSDQNGDGQKLLTT
ncbi:sterile alpha motif domain-containing protein 14 [Salminus brasiliensis]|uniref:sterile alpha motif domain-containing protein 14 n=1 Tax=Salminus brasiliensis TaxID=930266 RepID=UPI003B837EF8